MSSLGTPRRHPARAAARRRAAAIQRPGRYSGADAGILLTRVTSVKRGEETFIGVDAGMNTLVRPAMYGAYHHIVYPLDVRLPHDTPVHVVGQICEARDVIARERPLPRSVKVGDVLALLDAGATACHELSRFTPSGRRRGTRPRGRGRTVRIRPAPRAVRGEAPRVVASAPAELRAG